MTSISFADRQLRLVAGVLVALVVILIAAYFVLRAHYQVLFTDLRPQDAATVVTELDRLKVPYRLDNGGTTILVPEGDVHAVRLKVMSRDLPLKGTVGFELFNNSDLGLTEFAQKVNFQRALQGELSRTIMSLESVETARVHLALPEAGMFRRSTVKPKASVAILPRNGSELSPESVRGIQRLVAAAVPELDAADVTILDQRGASAAGKGSGLEDPKLEFKAAVETYYAHKAQEALAAAIGPTHATVLVDAALNFDQVKITQETTDVRGAPIAKAAAPVESDSLALDAELKPTAPVPGRERGSRRLEQIVSTPGAVKRLTVAVILKGSYDAMTLARIKEVTAAVMGLSLSRGDVVTAFVQEKDVDRALIATPESVVPRAANAKPIASAPLTQSDPRPPTYVAEEHGARFGWIALGVVFLILLISGVAYFRVRREPRLLTDHERQAMAERLSHLLSQDKDAARVAT